MNYFAIKNCFLFVFCVSSYFTVHGMELGHRLFNRPWNYSEKRIRSRSLICWRTLKAAGREIIKKKSEKEPNFTLQIPSDIQIPLNKKEINNWKKNKSKTTDHITEASPQFELTKVQQDSRAVKLLTKEKEAHLEKIKIYREMIHSLSNSMEVQCGQQRSWWCPDDCIFDCLITPATIKALITKHEKRFDECWKAERSLFYYKFQCEELEKELTKLKADNNQLRQEGLQDSRERIRLALQWTEELTKLKTRQQGQNSQLIIELTEVKGLNESYDKQITQLEKDEQNAKKSLQECETQLTEEKAKHEAAIKAVERHVAANYALQRYFSMALFIVLLETSFIVWKFLFAKKSA